MRQKDLIVYLSVAFFTLFVVNTSSNRYLNQVIATTAHQTKNIIKDNTQPINKSAPTPEGVQKETPTPTPKIVEKEKTNCIITGCSGEICANEETASTCQYKQEYACFKSAICETQDDGECGWTTTKEFTACIGASI